MINRKRKSNNLLIIVLVISLLTILMYVFYKNEYFFKLNLYFSDIGYKLEDTLIIKRYDIKKNIISGINRNIEKENNELKKILSLDNNKYELIEAIIVERNENWYNSLIINKGKKDGIDINMAVINGYGLIGKIIKVADNYSEVLLLTSDLIEGKIAVDVNNYHGILDGYDPKEDVLFIRNITKESNIEIGDKVYTNGIGGIYPAGIYIGDVISVSDDNLNLAKIVKVKIHSDISDIKYLCVIRS